MNLISDIISELLQTEQSLESPLLKTKVLATRVNNVQLLEWCNDELTGYSNEKEIPYYRKTNGFITANYLNGNYKFSDGVIPIDQLSKTAQKTIKLITLDQGIKTIESYALKSKQIGLQFIAEVVRGVQSSLQEQNPYLQILSMKSTAPSGFASNIISTVRAKLLEFMLSLEKEFGTTTEIENLKQKNALITTIMNHTIINNGNANVVNTGDHSNVTANITFTGNKNLLKEQFENHGVSKDDIDSLITVIDTPNENSNSNYNSEVNSWIKIMMGKALDGTWQIGIAAAGGLIAEVLNHYYGVH
ncbi:MAG: hypothetical protein JWR02_3119 [Mucilaginibacter sp.]|nr:hypothetical protein [Mucilaginibacter sp.]